MSVARRLALLFKVKANKVLDRAEDPREVLDYSYQRQVEMLAKVEAFRTRKETIKASYTAAEAQTRISEAVSGISEEMGDVGLAMQRAEDKTAQMQARAAAVDELMASGALDDASLPAGRDDIQAALDAAAGPGTDIDRELAALKGNLAAPAALAARAGARAITAARPEQEATS